MSVSNATAPNSGPHLPARYAAGARFGRHRAPFSIANSQAALPGFVVQAVLQFADEREEQGDGRLALRLSAGRASEHAVRVILGERREQALRLCLLWDPLEGQLVSVGEDQHPAHERACGSDDELWDEARAA